MSSGSWELLQQLFEGARPLPAAERRRYLDRECASRDAAELRPRVEALLAAAESGSMVIGGAIGQAAAETVSSDATSSHLGSGTRLGRYEVRSALGEGGMGHVYRARDTALDRDVAIKLLSPAVLATEAGRSRFEREAQAAASLRHANIVTIHDVGQDEDQPFIVMELVDGETLREKMKGELTESDYLPWAIQIADALTAAHGQGIVHRDLKPENVIVDLEGQARIVDFGLASLGDALLEPPQSVTTVTRLTGFGAILGTPGYMSPEAIGGEPTDARSDQFALGAILYELVTGTSPFGAATAERSLAATVGPESPDWSRLEGASPGLRAVIERCLRRAPDERYPESSAVLEALRGLLVSRRRPGPQLPKARTELIGRESERQAIRHLIVDERVRLVTLTGPGGSGKSRLALQVAEDLEDCFGSQVYFVELGAIREAALVAPAIANVLGAGGDRAPIEAIRVELSSSDEPCLVVLDNFEQVVSAARELGELLAKVASLTLLVTSREVLRIYGEYDFPVEPLAFPRGGRLLPTPELKEYPAVALFVARARAASPSFELNAENAEAVAELCARLDGLPLALELAAARARALSPEEMLGRLGSQKGLLSSGARDLPERHKTLQATLDWSYELVEESERVLFRRLAVFAGGFTLEAAEAVTDGYGDLEVDLVDGVASLVDKSLVQKVEGSAGESRFTLLETVREFARGKLEEHEELQRTRRAHAAYYVVLAEGSGAELAGASDERGLATLRLEHDNCRTALDWLTESGEAEWGLRLALGLFDFWDRTGYLVEGQLRFTRLLALEASRGRRRLRARGLFSAAAFAASRGQLEEAIRLQQENLQLYRELGDQRGQAVVLNALGIAASTDHFDHSTARSSFTEALDIWRALDDTLGYARSLSNLAWVLKTEGERDEARRMYREAGELFSSEGKAIDAAWAVNHEADVVLESGGVAEAAKLYRVALDRFEELGYRWGIATTLADLSALSAQVSDWAAATRTARQALELFVELGHRRGMVRLLESLAAAALEKANPEVGLTLVACADILRGQLGVELPADERATLEARLETMRAAAGAEAASSAWERGTALPVEEVVRLALSF